MSREYDEQDVDGVSGEVSDPDHPICPRWRMAQYPTLPHEDCLRRVAKRVLVPSVPLPRLWQPFPGVTSDPQWLTFTPRPPASKRTNFAGSATQLTA